MNDRAREPGVPLEQFIAALTSQLDRAQNAMAIKARLGYPLTFAVKDLTMELRAHVEMSGSAIQIRPAGPGDAQASTIHLALTTITRPMMEENTVQLSAEPGEPSLKEALGDSLSDEERRRLEWAGVQTVAQLVELQRGASTEAIEKVANVPALRLRQALNRASRPIVRDVVPQHIAPGAAPAVPPRLRIRGFNLTSDDGLPEVRLDGAPVRVLEARRDELLVEPLSVNGGGTLEVETAPGIACQMQLLTVPAPPTASEAAGNGAGHHDAALDDPPLVPAVSAAALAADAEVAP